VQVKVLAVFLWTLSYTLPSLISAEILVLYNKKVPQGKDLALEYMALHHLEAEVLLGVDVSVRESLTMEDYLQFYKTQLAERVEAQRPSIVLTVYGMPLWVEHGDRLRAFDQLLTMGEGAEHLDERLILNPLLQTPVSPFASQLIRVSRLDGPSFKQAKMMLTQWQRMDEMGCWRRYCLSGIDEEMEQLMLQRGLWLDRKPALNLVPLDEVQFLHAHQGKIKELNELHKNQFLPPGAMLLRFHSSSFRDGDFRSLGDGDAASACMMGVSFYIGAQKTQQPQEDLFDPLLFFLKFSEGASFVDAAYLAMPNICGSLLVLGDPLAKPFAKESVEKQKAYFEKDQLEDPSDVELARFNQAKDWWLVRDYYQLWNEGRVEIVLASLKVATIRRRSELFYEQLIRSYRQLGRNDDVVELLTKWPVAKRSAWVKNVLENLGF